MLRQLDRRHDTLSLLPSYLAGAFDQGLDVRSTDYSQCIGVNIAQEKKKKSTGGVSKNIQNTDDSNYDELVLLRREQYPFPLVLRKRA